jgi:hypothetical protein
MAVFERVGGAEQFDPHGRDTFGQAGSSHTGEQVVRRPLSGAVGRPIGGGFGG